MSFPLYYFLITYFIFLLIWSILSLVAIYHVLRFGFLNFATLVSTLIFIIVSTVILIYSYNFINQIDWNLNVSLWQGVFNQWFSL